jgi:Na+/proline symporter
MFITTAESLLNWGASFLTMDAYKEYVNSNASEKRIRWVSFGSMLGLSLLAMFFAMQIDSLQSLVKVTFSIAAGVAPVYILRWIWFRINAWSQLSAMLSSAVFTLIYPEIHAILPLNRFPIEESRVVIVTILTTIVWLFVTFLTVDQSDQVRLKMMPILESRKVFVRDFCLALTVGFFVLVLVYFMWTLILN